MWASRIVAFLSFFILLGIYGGGFLSNHETTISEEEIVISRVNLIPFSHTEFAVNLSNGNEEIRIYGGPFTDSWTVYYNGTCECIEQVYKHRIGRNIWYVSYNFSTDEEVHYSSGKTIQKKLSLQEAQPYFDEGMQIRNSVRKRFAKYLPSEK